MIKELLNKKGYIKDIHTSFDKSGEILINEANKILEGDFLRNLQTKQQLLTSCGFTNTKLSNEINELQDKVSKSKEIQTYSDKFNGLYKVITLDEVCTISKKYKLCVGRSQWYKENVPEQNLREIATFISKVAEKTFCKISEELLIAAPEKEFHETIINSLYVRNGRTIQLKDPIVLAPCNFKLDLPGWGSVLRNQYFYIVTKWGLEASDELVVNQKFN